SITVQDGTTVVSL
nr:immunoglobulin heavy chain junction region [Mus musculus]